MPLKLKSKENQPNLRLLLFRCAAMLLGRFWRQIGRFFPSLTLKSRFFLKLAAIYCVTQGHYRRMETPLNLPPHEHTLLLTAPPPPCQQTSTSCLRQIKATALFMTLPSGRFICPAGSRRIFITGVSRHNKSRHVYFHIFIPL